MLNNRALITHMGLASRDLAVIQSILHLAVSLKDKYELAGAGETRTADVVFVNADDETALQCWQAFSKDNPYVSGVLVTSNDKFEAKGIVLRRPMVLRKLIDALELIASTDASHLQNSVSSDAAMKILVVDDSLPVRTFMQHKLPELADHAVSIEFAASGEEAMAKIEQQLYDLIFLDVVMPGIDGYKVCKWIKANRPSYVVMLTSKKSPFDKVRGSMSGCDDYLTKPPQEERLKKVLTKRAKDLAGDKADPLTVGQFKTALSS